MVDDSTLWRAKDGNNAAFSELVGEYQPLISSMLERYRFEAAECGLDEDDLRQEAIIALYSAVKAYDTNQDAVTFGLYSKICIRNRLSGIIRQHRGKNGSVMPEETSDSPAYDPEQGFIDRESYEQLTRVIDESLTEYEKSVFKLFILDKSYREIAEILGRDAKSVDNAICRIKKKLKQRI